MTSATVFLVLQLSKKICMSFSSVETKCSRIFLTATNKGKEDQHTIDQKSNERSEVDSR